MKRMIEVRESLKKKILDLPDGNSLLEKGISNAIYRVNNGAGEKIAGELGEESFRESKKEISSNYDEWINERDRVAKKHQYLITKIVKKNRMVDKEDAYQEGYITVLDCLEKYDDKKGPEENYISKCIKYEIRKCSCSNVNPANRSDDDINNFPDKSPDNKEDNLLLDAIWKKAAGLTSMEEKVLKLRFKENKNREDIANTLSMTTQCVKNIETKAINKFKEIFITEVPEHIQMIKDIKKKYGLG